MTQTEYDQLEAVVVHMTPKGSRNALCSGLEVDPDTWERAGPEVLLKLCQACFIEMMKGMFSAK